MSQFSSVTKAARLSFLICCVLAISQSWATYGQTGEKIQEALRFHARCRTKHELHYSAASAVRT